MHSATPSVKKVLLTAAWPIFFALQEIGKALYSVGLSYRFQKDWGALPMPEWFDHEYDLAFFPSWRKVHFFERGVYLQEILRTDHEVLDLCCGDGSVTALFISPKVKSVVGVDFDPGAIRRARQRYVRFGNVTYQVGDIRKIDFPKAKFDVVTWDAAIEHFTKEEMNSIFASIRSVLKSGGMLAGSTLAKQEHVQHHDHEFEFSARSELEAFLGEYFPNVYVWERIHEDRRNFYFRCSENPAALIAR